MPSTAQDTADAAKAGDTAKAEDLIAKCTDITELTKARELVAAINPQADATLAILAAIDARIQELLGYDGGGDPNGTRRNNRLGR